MRHSPTCCNMLYCVATCCAVLQHEAAFVQARADAAAPQPRAAPCGCARHSGRRERTTLAAPLGTRLRLRSRLAEAGRTSAAPVSAAWVPRGHRVSADRTFAAVQRFEPPSSAQSGSGWSVPMIRSELAEYLHGHRCKPNQIRSDQIAIRGGCHAAQPLARDTCEPARADALTCWREGGSAAERW